MAPLSLIGKHNLNTEGDGLLGALEKLNILAKLLADNGIQVPAAVKEPKPPTSFAALPQELIDNIFFKFAGATLEEVESLRGEPDPKHIELYLMQIVKLVAKFSITRQSRASAIKHIRAADLPFSHDVSKLANPRGDPAKAIRGYRTYDSDLIKRRFRESGRGLPNIPQLPLTIPHILHAVIKTLTFRASFRQNHWGYGKHKIDIHGDPMRLFQYTALDYPHLECVAVDLLLPSGKLDGAQDTLLKHVQLVRQLRVATRRIRVSYGNYCGSNEPGKSMEDQTDKKVVETLIRGEEWLMI